MKDSDFINIKPEWLNGEGEHASIVITSRIRLARNLEGIPFPPRAGSSAMKQSLDLVSEAVEKSKCFKDFYGYGMENISAAERQILVENYLISPAFAETKNGRAVYIDSAGSTSIMVNEEDHLRMQYITSGLQLEKAWDKINEVDDCLEKNLDYAFNDNLGYLATCPTNVGTAMRVSVMLHLPVLAMTNFIPKIIPMVVKLGLTVRGIYGEGTEISGGFFQLSNQVSLGLTEGDILGKVKGITLQIVEQENNARKELKQGARLQITDRIHRAFGILKNAYLVSSQEALELLSMLRLGVDMGILPKVSNSLLNELVVLIRPASLQKYYGKKLIPAQRDKVRAELLKEKLAKF